MKKYALSATICIDLAMTACGNQKATNSLSSVKADQAPADKWVSVCDRSKAVQDSILESTGKADCSAVGAEDVAKIERFYLVKGMDTAPLASDFQGFTNATGLRLDSTYFPALNPGTFKEMKSLVGLFFYNDSTISSFTPGEFDGLPKLEMLNVSFLQATTIPVDAFAGLPSLKALWLTVPKLNEIQASAFRGVKVSITLQGTQLSHVTPGAFDGSSPSSIDLSNNKIVDFEVNTFQGTTDVRSLSLSGNAISHVDADILRGLNEIAQLNLASNKIEVLPAGFLKAPQSLTALDLRGNPLNQIDSLAFADLPGLKSINIMNTPVAADWKNLCARFPKIRIVYGTSPWADLSCNF